MIGEQVELGPLLLGGVEVVVGRDLEEIDAVAAAEQLGEERLAEAEPDADAGRSRSMGSASASAAAAHHSRLHTAAPASASAAPASTSAPPPPQPPPQPLPDEPLANIVFRSESGVPASEEIPKIPTSSRQSE